MMEYIRRRYATTDPQAAAKMRLSAMDALDRKRARGAQDELLVVAGESKGVNERRLVFGLETRGSDKTCRIVVSELERRVGRYKRSASRRVEAARSARTDDQRTASSGQGLSPIEDQDHADQVRGATVRELDDGGNLSILLLVAGGFPLKAAVDSRLAPTRKW